MTRWDRLMMRLGLHRHERTVTTSFVFGAVECRCWCGFEFETAWQV